MNRSKFASGQWEKPEIKGKGSIWRDRHRGKKYVQVLETGRQHYLCAFYLLPNKDLEGAIKYIKNRETPSTTQEYIDMDILAETYDNVS